MSKVIYEGWMVRYGRRKIGRSFIHMRYFVLEPTLLAYYKKKPEDNQVPIKTLLIDGNCRVEDRGLKTQHGHMVYVLSVYNKKDKYNRITMAAFNIQEQLIWKGKIEFVIDQHQESQVPNGNKYASFEYKSGMDNGRTASSSDCEIQFIAQEDEDDSHTNLLRRTTIGNGPPASVFDWTQLDSDLTNQNANNQAFSRKHWRLLQCQNGLRIFEELLEVEYLPRSCSRAMKAVGVVEASCEDIFELIMSMDAKRFEWDCSFQHGSLVEEVDGHTAILYHRLQLDWFPIFVWPRDLCYVRYWRRNDDGSYVVLFRSRVHEKCDPQPGYVRAHIESGGFIISPLKPCNEKPRTQVQHLMQIDLKGWGVGYVSSFQQHCLLQMLNSVAGLRELFSQTDERGAPPRIAVMANMASASAPSKKNVKLPESSVHPTPPLDQTNAASRHSVMDEDTDDDEEFPMAEEEQEAFRAKHENDAKRTALEEEPVDQIDLSCFSGNLRRDDRDNARDCWQISDGNNFRVRSKRFCFDKSKVPAGKHLMDLVAVDWFKDTKRMDHVARRQGCAAQVASEKGLFSVVFNLQVPGSTHYSMVFYFVTKELLPGSLLQRFVDGDDEFRNSRFKLIPSVPKGSWIVRQSVGSTPCLLGKAVDCNYIRGPKYLEVDVDIGSSTVANGVLGLVIGVITTLVVDMAFLVQANTTEELPERSIGAVRVSHIELSSAIVPKLDPDPS
ncbi:PREDICTED: protein ENHANCED DISEASE RESISTANCE 2-like [Populus euphratica]|uniref:Protein ENHANCED DISEASE RESISTANCE 2-like n=1 Tax=Populus euphratica TaxID=75702 RepID=A0AAJ6XH32_POPEU|nr:PREDICTED: protein ENHANCED DISEASE RESISTANCE 2-like [Populus euphratica]